MPIHDWKRVEAGIFHHFHHDWISEIARSLNSGLLPTDYYAMAEQQAAGFGPDVLTLQGGENGRGGAKSSAGPSAGLLPPPTRVRFAVESKNELFRRKASTLVVRHISGDRIVAIIEVISPGNKASRFALRALVKKATELLHHKIHVLLLDLFPPTKRDPNGIHAAIWEEIDHELFEPPPGQPLTLVSYEADTSIRAYIEPVAVGEALPDMPLFLEPDGCIMVPLEATYNAAFAAVPQRWRTVLEAPADASA